MLEVIDQLPLVAVDLPLVTVGREGDSVTLIAAPGEHSSVPPALQELLDEPKFGEIALTDLLSGISDKAIARSNASFAQLIDSGEDMPIILEDEEQDIIVTARYRYRNYNYDDGSGGASGDDGSGRNGGGRGGSAPAPAPPPLECATADELSRMSPEEREDYDIAAEAAEIAREITAKSDKDTNEYGSLIYRDANGVITHTPLTRGTNTTVAIDATGIPNFGQVLAMVHSHAANTFTSNQPFFKLFPTPNVLMPNGQGDWYGFDYYKGQIRQALLSQGASTTDAAIAAGAFRQFIVGPTATAGTGSYALVGYNGGDRDTITLGQKINMNLGLCS